MQHDRWSARHAATWERNNGPGEPSILLTSRFSTPPSTDRTYRALDVACGLGRHAIYLAEHGWHVEGIDISPTAIELATRAAEQQGLADRITLRTANMVEPSEAPDVGEETYDLIVVAYLHVPHAPLAHLMNRLSRALTPGGQLFMFGHDLRNLKEGHGGPQDRDVLYTPDQLHSLAEECGLEVREAETVSRPLSDEGIDMRDAVSLDAVLRAVKPQ